MKALSLAAVCCAVMLGWNGAALAKSPKPAPEKCLTQQEALEKAQLAGALMHGAALQFEEPALSKMMSAWNKNSDHPQQGVVMIFIAFNPSVAMVTFVKKNGACGKQPVISASGLLTWMDEAFPDSGKGDAPKSADPAKQPEGSI